jgi:sugar phosphate isomerase/epimerase
MDCHDTNAAPRLSSMETTLRTLSLAHLTVLDADPVGLIEAGQAGGFDAVGLRVMPPLPGDTIVPIVGDRAMQRRTKDALKATGTSILSIEAFWLQPDTEVNALRPALELGAELGAKYVLTVSFDEDQRRLQDNFGAFCECANALGLRPMFEFISFSAIKTLADAHTLLTTVAPKDAGILVDALHLSRSGGHPRDIAAYDPALFSYIHLCDAPSAIPPAEGLRPEARGGRLDPGDGKLWLDAFVDAFPHGTTIELEVPIAARAGLSITERARLTGEATRIFLKRHDGRA